MSRCLTAALATLLALALPAHGDLRAAILDGDIEAVRRQLSAGAEVEETYDNGATPLIVAASRGSNAIVNLLLDHGAQVDATDDDGNSALISALREGRTDTAELLIRRGADATLRNKKGDTPFELAVRHDSVAVTDLIDTALANTSVAVNGFDPWLASTVDAVALADLYPPPVRPLGIAVVGDWLYWSQHATDSIHRAHLDGSAAEVLVIGEVDGPVGVTVDAGDLIFWTTDGGYPRRIQAVSLVDSTAATLALGAAVNRPAAIALDPVRKGVFWTEAVSGRIRRADFDGSKLQSVVTDGIATREEQPGATPLVALGIAVDAQAKRIYWSDLIRSAIRSSNLDGTDTRDLFTAADGIDSPAGIALDSANGHLYWSDTDMIRRGRVDGSGIEDLLGPADGLEQPHAVALDLRRGRIYWSDLALDTIARASLDGSGAESISSLRDGTEAPADDSSCAERVAAAGETHIRRILTAFTLCLRKVDAIKAVKRNAAAAAPAARTCAGRLSTVAAALTDDTRLAQRLRAAVEGPCERTAAPGGPRVAAAQALIDRCEASRTRPDEDVGWVDCVASSYKRAASLILARRFGRAVEWLEEVRPFIASMQREDAGDRDAALAAIDGAIASITESRSRHPSASGQTTSYPARRQGGREPVAVPDDGGLRSGPPPAFRDNRDGTITDLNTGLMWEKKCDGCGGLHDSAALYAWEPSGASAAGVRGWIEAVNAEGEGGFAGHTDWRVPTIQELLSIVDFERFNPAVGVAFDGALCGLGCNDLAAPACSCTGLGGYWSATPAPGAPGSFLGIAFNLGLIGDLPPATLLVVRAVRG